MERKGKLKIFIMVLTMVASAIKCESYHESLRSIHEKLDQLQHEVRSLREESVEKPMVLKWCYTPNYTYIAKKEVRPSKGNLVYTISKMGPAFYIKFDFLVTSFSGPQWRNIMKFTATDKNCCNAGDRIPAIFSRSDGIISYTTIHKSGNIDIEQTANTNRWYSTEIMQYYDNYQWNYEIRVDGHILYLKKYSDASPTYKNVKVYIGDKYHEPGLVKIKDFQYGNLSLEK